MRTSIYRDESKVIVKTLEAGIAVILDKGTVVPIAGGAVGNEAQDEVAVVVSRHKGGVFAESQSVGRKLQHPNRRWELWKGIAEPTDRDCDWPPRSQVPFQVVPAGPTVGKIVEKGSESGQ